MTREALSSIGWVQLCMLRAWPIAAMASTGRGMRVVYHKEGVDPGEPYAHHSLRLHQRR